LCASLECGHIIVAWRDDSLNDFNEDDLWFAGQIATLVSSSLATSLLYEHQVAVAQAFQRDMIPSPPSIRNCEIAVFYNPVTQGIDIGGDFCDVIELPDDKVVIVIGDVSGKGLESAVQAGQTRAMIRALVRSNPEPGAVIHSLNAGLYSYLPTDSFVTLFYCVLDTTTGSLRYVNAGHEPPMLAGSDSGVRILSRSGPILGILEEAYQETHYASLINGEALLCYTDGVTDVLINDEWLGQDGLRDIISRFPNYEAESLVQTIVDVVANPENVQRKDDQLLVAVRLSAHL
jgi:serine phosphatase RsbU (regulator of sigma subunit)